MDLNMRAADQKVNKFKIEDFEDKSLLIVDDDDPLRGRLARAMEKKGFQVKESKTVSEGLEIAKNSPTSFALVDLRLEDGKIAVLNSSVKFLYQNGKITENNDDWLDEYDDFKYDQDISSFDDSYKYKGKEKTNQAYYKVSIFGAGATALGLKDINGASTGSADPVHFGIGFQNAQIPTHSILPRKSTSKGSFYR